jgi:hypothetical protein
MAKPNGTNGTTRRVIGVSSATHAKIVRFSALYNRSAAQLLDRIATNLEARWRSRMTQDQWRRFVAEPSGISPAEARAIYAAAERDGGDAPPTAPNGSSKEFVL